MQSGVATQPGLLSESVTVVGDVMEGQAEGVTVVTDCEDVKRRSFKAVSVRQNGKTAHGFEIGAEVVAHSLLAASLNGALGHVVAARGERVAVSFPDPFGDKALKPANLKLPKTVQASPKEKSSGNGKGDDEFKLPCPETFLASSTVNTAQASAVAVSHEEDEVHPDAAEHDVSLSEGIASSGFCLAECCRLEAIARFPDDLPRQEKIAQVLLWKLTEDQDDDYDEDGEYHGYDEYGDDDYEEQDCAH